jgi:ABC-2 type transport system ATP-binding protein
MDHGKLLALGTPEELKGSIEGDTIVTVTADGDLDELAGRLRREVDGVDSATTLDGSVQLAVRGTDRVLVRVIGAADDAGFAVRDVQVAPPTLETVFINLTGKELRD